VTRFRPGYEVCGLTTVGSFAEYARSRRIDLARKPVNLTFEQAAAGACLGHYRAARPA
jgi:NADPH:quinone reductase-like Zn-dependent oxidoreductase